MCVVPESGASSHPPLVSSLVMDGYDSSRDFCLPQQVKLDEELVSQRCFQMISLQEQGTVYVSGQTLSNLEILVCRS